MELLVLAQCFGLGCNVLALCNCPSHDPPRSIYADGNVEPRANPEHPDAALNYRSIPSETGIYAYYADFDRDGIEDMAVWYDSAFRALCLLAEDGHAKKTFTFENGVDIYETYHQRAAEIKHEPNQIRVSETVNGVESVYYFRVKEDGLHLRAGVMHDPSKTDVQWFQVAADDSVPFDDAAKCWISITEEAYRRIVEDYQVMQYRLIPIC